MSQQIHQTVAEKERNATVSEVKEWLEEWDLHNSVTPHWPNDDNGKRQVSFVIPSFSGFYVTIAQEELDQMGWHIEQFEANNTVVLTEN